MFEEHSDVPETRNETRNKCEMVAPTGFELVFESRVLFR